MAAQTATYKVSGMHCASCASIIERKVGKVPGVTSVSVSPGTEVARVTQSGVDLTTLNAAIAPLGYRLLPEDGNAAPLHKKSHEEHAAHDQNSLSLRRHVLAAVPIVVLSVVVMAWEIGIRFERLPMMPETVAQVVRYGMPLLATYMLFVVGRPFLLGVWRFIRYGSANMDTLIGIGTLVAYSYSLVVLVFADALRPYLPVESTYFDVTIVVIGFITFGKYLEARAKSRTNDALRSLVALQAKTALVERDGQELSIPLEQIVVGDRVIVKPGAKVPVDGKVVQGESYLNESMVTGEPMPVAKAVGDVVTGGTLNGDGYLVATATGVGKDSLLAHIIDLVKSAQSSKAPIQKLADKISSIFVPIVLGIATASLLGWLLVGSQFMPFQQALALGLSSFVGVLVIACPCALGLATPTAIIVGVGKGARKGILIKNASVLEKLSKVRDIIFDKTGTVTEGNPKVVAFANASQRSDADVRRLAAAIEKQSEHPIARAITAYAGGDEHALPTVERFVAHKGLGAAATIGGVEYAIGSDTFIKDATEAELDEPLLQRELATSSTPVILATKQEVLAYFFIGDAVKKTASNAIKDLHALGVQSHMATGDQELAAQTVAAAVGIDTHHARMLPEEKQLLVRELKKKGALVAVAGDGVNDAPALAASDVGIAMSTGTDVAIDTADVTLLHGDISKISEAFALSRQTLRAIKQNLFWAFAFNVVGIPVAAGVLYPLGITLSPALAGAAMAFSSVLVVGNSLRLKLSNA